MVDESVTWFDPSFEGKGRVNKNQIELRCLPVSNALSHFHCQSKIPVYDKLMQILQVHDTCSEDIRLRQKMICERLNVNMECFW